MALQKNQIISLSISGVTSEGNGIGRCDGMAVFVPYTVPGDQLMAKVVKVNKSYAYAIAERMTRPSNLRVDPVCPVFGKCGGCALRSLSYEAELSIKEDWVRQDLRRIGKCEPNMLPIIPSPNADRYRNKALIPVAVGKDGRAVSGFYAPRSHRVLPCADCLLQPEEFAPITAAVLEYAEQCGVAPYDEEKHTGTLRHIFLRKAEATGQIMVVLVVTKFGLPRTDLLVEKVRTACAQVSGVLLNRNDAVTNVIMGTDTKLLWGSEVISDVLCGVKLNISPLAFYQVNRQGAQLLYQEAARMAGLSGNELLLDLYCGAGTIGLSMAGQVRELIGVEIVPQAIENAKTNAAANGVTNARFMCADAGQAAARLAEEGLRPDVVLVDPPRKGCSLETIEAICAMAPQRVVMVSCNSATAARDVELFAQRGYKAAQARAVDMFPRTANVEAVILLTKKGSK
ncbi:MAG: 23S rRNA (uracil(1939)-C(5))-methyltransferase RlmD [Oscillospiraceae bacterium]|nr:23S rRNA (uracil(1939)-C(5))-methyltransferase RlmD [Oscillospiraceae bacterium]